MRAYFFAAATILLGLYGQLVLKYRATLHVRAGSPEAPASFIVGMLLDPWVLSSFAGAFVAALCWMLAVRDLGISVLYPLLGASFVLIPLGAVVFLDERVTKLQLLGLAMIVVGIALAARPN